ncbi:MAG TPA: hypothetical protein H9958_09535 [Candidatus Limosilactobacillus intestinavium]|nr:hypothetical protein [Candidatus Limosilactobacillus intestinavium]
MTKEGILNDLYSKVKKQGYQIDSVSRSNTIHQQSFTFYISKANPPREVIDKLLKENSEIASKMIQLEKFMQTEGYERLSDKEQRLMIIQYNAMQVYADVLLQRIDEIKERLC